MVTGGKHPRSHDGIARTEPTVGPSTPSGVTCQPAEVIFRGEGDSAEMAAAFAAVVRRLWRLP